MPIKDFVIGPQNYWEEGYFAGDYTHPNVSKSFLICDIDNIKGGLIITGEYYQDNYIDGTYFHRNALEGSMSIQADRIRLGSILATGYFVEGYYQTGYIEQGIVVSMAVVAGRLGEISSTLNSLMSTTCSGVKSIQAVSTMSVSFNQTAIVNKIGDIDLYAFTNGSLASTVQALREYQLSASDSFDIATDFVRQRDVGLDADAVFIQDIVFLRNRDTSLETQVAFSFAIIESFVRGIDASITSTSSINCTISHIEGADISAFNNASLNVDAVKTVVTSSTMSSTINQTATFTGTSRFVAPLKAYAGLFASRNIGTNPPVTITGSFTGSQLINSGSARPTDLSDLPNWESWFYETSVLLQNAGNWQSQDATQVFDSPFGSITVRYRTAQGVTISVNALIRGTTYTGQYATGVLNNPAFSQTFKCAISFTGGQKLAIYVDNQRVFLNNDVFTGGWTIANSGSVQFAPGYPRTYSSVVHNCYTDFAWLTRGDYTNSGGSTYTSINPLVYTENTVFLYNFNGNGQETRNLTQTAQSAISSAASFTGKLSGPEKFASSINSSFSLNAIISHIEGSDITAFTNASLQTTATKIKQISSDFNVATSSEISAIKTTDIIENISSQSLVSIDANRTRDNEITAISIASKVTVVLRIAGLTIDTNTVSTVLALVNRTTENQITAESTSQCTATALRLKSLESQISDDFEIFTDADVVKDAQSDFITESNITILNDRTRDYDIVSSIVSSLAAVAFNLGKIEATMFDNASLNAVITKTTDYTSVIVSNTSLNATTINSVIRITGSDLNFETSETATAVKTVDVPVIINALASELTVAVKQASLIAEMSTQASISVLANVNASAAVTLSGTFTQSSNAGKNVSVLCDSTSTSAITATGIFVTQAQANLSGIAFEITVAAITASYIADLTSSFVVGATASVIRTTSSSIQSSNTMVVTVTKIVSGQSQITAAQSLTATVGYLANGVVTISSAMTFLSSVREIHVEEIVYVIPGEIWVYDIISETRSYTISSETRLYTIQGD